MKPMVRTLFLALLMASLATVPVLSQQPEEPEPTPTEEGQEPEEGQRGRGRGGRGGDDAADEGIKPYEEVITDEAETQEGLFKVHQIKDDVYFEIPTSELGKEFLMVTRIAKTQLGQGFGGQKLGTRVVRWVRRGDRIFLRNVNHDIIADPSLPIAQAVADSNTEAIISAFNIAALGEDDAPVIEVTSLYATEVTEFSARSRLQARGFDRQRSYVDRVMVFPTNIEIRAAHTYTRPPDNAPATRGGRGRGRGNRGMAPGSATLEIAFSMIKLPEDPMMPRLYDDRVGYFTDSYIDYGQDAHRSEERRFITRWRLDKQDPSAEISDPVKPIVYYVDPATPAEWVPWVIRGVEDWQPAFEAAGFSNAIIGREAPDDPNWSPEDARYSVIRWLASETENASGPHVHDPRTGEILESDIQFYHNVMNLLRDWYFVQVAPLDPAAQTLPLSDDLMGRLLEFVVAHEVGHTLGFQHNMKASSTYDFENIRDPEWLAEMSHTPSIMDYSRFNYVVQPEDGVPAADLIPGVGPYDKWATMWGYKPIPDADTPDAELSTLNQWALEQEDTPWYRFSTTGDAGSDPGDMTEAVGDANAVEATRLGVRNLERVMDLLIGATSKPGRNWDELEEMYGRTLGQWVREMNHVGALVGGFLSQQRHDGQDGVRFWPVPADRQAEAVRFLNENAFQTPEFMIRPDILRRIEPSGVLARLLNSQRSVMNFLLNPARFTRLVEQEALDTTAYTPTRFLGDLRRGVWSELSDEVVSTDAFRRNVQRLYLDLINARLNGTAEAPADMRALLRGQLNVLDGEISAALSRADDQITRYHLEDARDRVGEILNPTPALNAAAEAFAEQFAESDPFNPYTVHGCWVDFIISPN
jgi:hypothetical protein